MFPSPVSMKERFEVLRTVEEKYQAIIDDIKQAREKKAAGLVATTSIRTKSEISCRIVGAKPNSGFSRCSNAANHGQEA